MTDPDDDATDGVGTCRRYDLLADHYAAEISDELRVKRLDRALLDTFAEATAPRRA
jgi:hypothetical protein